MNIADSIIKTLAFFNLFNHPLTNFELHQLLYTPEPVDFFKVLKEAESLKPKIQAQDGFFFLSANVILRPPQAAEESRLVERGILPPHPVRGQDDNIKKRQIRTIDNDKKFRIAQKAAQLISWVPFVKLVAVCNTLSFGAAEEKSDIDFFIIARKGRIWTVRFFITAILSFFGLRRHGKKIQDRICLSFYLADDNLNLESIALPSLRHSERSEESLPDIYLIYWITQLVPLINRSQTLEKFWQANLWVKDYLANFSFESQLPDYRQIKIPTWVEGWRRLHERITAGRLGDWREKVLRWLQWKKINRCPRPQEDQPRTAVIISDQMLKFHEEDRREELRRRWREVLTKNHQCSNL